MKRLMGLVAASLLGIGTTVGLAAARNPVPHIPRLVAEDGVLPPHHPPIELNWVA